LLHVTNGDSAGGALRQAGFHEEILPWRDVLHEGPVREGLTLQQLSEERARFIAEAGWGRYAEVNEDFRRRDEHLQRSRNHGEVVLWFEHDLYDQLQLIQILDWFARNPHPRLTMICEAEYVGRMKAARMQELFRARTRVTGGQLREAGEAWAAFAASDPSRILSAAKGELRFLGAALRRQLEEYPWTTDGLSRLERQILDVLENGARKWQDIFLSIEEQVTFLGDVVLRWHLARMAAEGLVEETGNLWVLKSRTRTKRVPRWLGGVRVDDACPWRWDPAAGRLVQV
jgi:hypothetical protein